MDGQEGSFTGFERLKSTSARVGSPHLALQSLDLSNCDLIIGDLSPLAGLTSLDLAFCQQLSGDLSLLAAP